MCQTPHLLRSPHKVSASPKQLFEIQRLHSRAIYRPPYRRPIYASGTCPLVVDRRWQLNLVRLDHDAACAGTESHGGAEMRRCGAEWPLATPRLQKNRLSCSPDWTRTNNRPINSRMLCQLSYRGLPGTRWLCREPRHDSSLRAGVKAKPDGPPTSDKEDWHDVLSLRAGQM